MPRACSQSGPLPHRAPATAAVQQRRLCWLGGRPPEPPQVGRLAAYDLELVLCSREPLGSSRPVIPCCSLRT
jgi:hypothetical protein